MPKRICVFGDSIVKGKWDDEKLGWVARLRLDIEKMEKGEDSDSVYNLGIAGDMTEWLLDRIDIECEARNPDVVIISIGMNDSSFRVERDGSFIEIFNFETNLRKIKNFVNRYTEELIFVGLTRVNEDITLKLSGGVSYKNADIAEYDKVTKNFCKENDLLFIEMADLLENDDLADGLHPTAVGHEKMFQRIKEQLIKNNILE